MKIKAYAKVNLALKVIRKREDGYHDLYTVMDLIDIYDTICIKNSKKMVFKCNDKNLENDNNLILKAVNIIKEECKNAKDKCANIYLNKKIPYGSGLGGGSSDAASTIVALNKIWNLGLSFEQMAKIALKVGSDVPFFLLRSRGILTGIGENVKAIKANKKLYYLLVFPGYSLSTKLVYENNTIFGDDCTKVNKLIEALNDNNQEGIIENLFNDLTQAACLINEKDPTIQHIIDNLNNFVKLNNYHAKAIMSGSGSCVFVCFASSSEFSNALKYIKRMNNKNDFCKNTCISAKTLL